MSFPSKNLDRASHSHPVVVVIPRNFIAEEYIPNMCVARSPLRATLASCSSP